MTFNAIHPLDFHSSPLIPDFVPLAIRRPSLQTYGPSRVGPWTGRGSGRRALKA